MVRRVRGDRGRRDASRPQQWGFHRLSPDAARHVVRRAGIARRRPRRRPRRRARRADRRAGRRRRPRRRRRAAPAAAWPSLRERFADAPVTVVRADVAARPPARRPFRVVANPPWSLAESIRTDLLRAPALVRADLVLPRWLVHRWAGDSPRDRGRGVAARRVVRAAGADGQRGRRGPRPPVDAATGPRADDASSRHGCSCTARCSPGRLRWPFLAPYAVDHRPADVAGLLYDSGYGWPVATFVAATALVPGHARRPRPDPRRRGARRARRGRGDGHRPARARRRDDDRRRAPRGRTTATARSRTWRASTAGTRPTSADRFASGRRRVAARACTPRPSATSTRSASPSSPP